MSKRQMVSLVTILLPLVIGMTLSLYMQWWHIVGIVVIAILSLVPAISSIKTKSEISIPAYIARLVSLFGSVLTLMLFNEDSVFIVYISNFLAGHSFLAGYSLYISTNTIGILAYFSFLVILYIVSNIFKHVLSDNSPMKKKTLDQKIFDDSFHKIRRDFCAFLRRDLDEIDHSTQFSDDRFVELDANFTITKGRKQKKSVRKLIPALRSTKKESAFLVLGDPGTGKSTALRKLARTLLDDVEKTNKIPLYINLRDWHISKNETQRPTFKSFSEFIKSDLRRRFKDDLYTPDFLDKYFDKQLKNGHFFFIFDSFDEIPFLLDEPESSDFVEHISDLFYGVITMGDGRGVLSSRFFRRPSSGFKSSTILEIKPFDEGQIRQCFKHFNNNDKIAKSLFSTKSELIPLVKIPFYANLMSMYYRVKGVMPSGEADLFEFYFKYQLEDLERKHSMISKANSTPTDIINATMHIARCIFDDSNITVRALVNSHSIPYDIFTILHEARILRFDPNDRLSVVTFTHRRFLEFFVASQLSEQDASELLSAIEENAKWHDVLVLYVQISAESKAIEAIEHCLQIIDAYINEAQASSTSKAVRAKKPKLPTIKFTDTYCKAIHSLRFLTAAFATNRAVISKYWDKLGKFTDLLIADHNYLNLKFAVESIPILSEESMLKILQITFKEHKWIRNDAAAGCIYLSKLPTVLIANLVKYYATTDIITYVRKFHADKFTLSLAPTYRPVRIYYYMRAIEFVLKICALLMMWMLVIFGEFLMPFGVVFMALLCVIFILINIRGAMSIYFPHSEWFMIIYFSFVLAPNVSLISVLLALELNWICNFFVLLLMLVILIPSTYTMALFRFRAVFLWKQDEYFTIISDMMKAIRKDTKLMITILSIITGVIVILALIVWLQSRFEVIMLMIISAASIIAMLVYAVSSAMDLIKDAILYRSKDINHIVDREYLSPLLQGFKTKKYRHKLLELIENEKITITGEWPEEIMPAFRDDHSNSLLARLEMKWRGFR